MKPLKTKLGLSIAQGLKRTKSRVSLSGLSLSLLIGFMRELRDYIFCYFF